MLVHYRLELPETCWGQLWAGRHWSLCPRQRFLSCLWTHRNPRYSCVQLYNPHGAAIQLQFAPASCFLHRWEHHRQDSGMSYRKCNRRSKAFGILRKWEHDISGLFFRPPPSLLLLKVINVCISVADPRNFGVDPDPDLDPRIHASYQWIRMRIRILLFSSLTFKMPTKN